MDFSYINDLHRKISWSDEMAKTLSTITHATAGASKVRTVVNQGMGELNSSPLLEIIKKASVWTLNNTQFDAVNRAVYLDSSALQYVQRFSSVTDHYEIAIYNKAYKELGQLMQKMDQATLLWKRSINLIPQTNEEPEAIESVSVEGERVKSLILDIYNDNDLIYTVDPRDFEHMVSEMLRKQGYKVELTKQTRDGGYDLIAITHLMGDPIKFLVECKRFAERRPVDVKIVRELMYVVGQENATKGLLVTSSYFSKDAYKEKDKHPYKLSFKDNADVLSWAYDYLFKK